MGGRKVGGKMKEKIITIFLMICIGLLYASHERLVSDLHIKYSQLNTFEADLVQTIDMPDMNMVLESTGKIFIAGDDYVIEFTEPMNQFVKVEGGMLTLFIKNDNLAYITNASDELLLGNFSISGIMRLSAYFEFIEIIDGFYAFNVNIPSNPDEDLKIFACEKDKLLIKMEIVGFSGNTTTLQMSNQRFNQPLSRKLCEFVVPADATVIRY
jgi:outer membrane lipoprotein-sorting protein